MTADHITADGWPVQVLLRMAGVRAQRLTGSDFVRRAITSDAFDGQCWGLLGTTAEQGRALKGLLAAGRLSLGVAEHGMVRDWRAADLLEDLRRATVDTVLIAVSAPAGDVFAAQLRQAGFEGRVVVVGAGVEMATGKARRAPVFIQKVGLEWAFRLALEPRRLSRRYLREGLPFVLTRLLPVGLETIRLRRSTGRDPSQ